MKHTAGSGSAGAHPEPERPTSGQTHHTAHDPLLPPSLHPALEPDEHAGAPSDPPAPSGEHHIQIEDVRAYLDQFDTSIVSSTGRDVMDWRRRANLGKVGANAQPGSPVSKQHEASEAIRESDAHISELDTQRLPAHHGANEPGLQDTNALRAILAAEQAHHMGAAKLSEHTQRAIRDYARRQTGAPALDAAATTALSQQLQDAGLPENIREAIIEFAGGPRGITGAPYFSPESNKLDTTMHSVALARRQRAKPSEKWWQRSLAALLTPATLVMALFAVAQVWLVLGQRTGPFLDEAIYIDAGVRTLQGFGISDNYLTWFAGSLLWPIVACFGYLAGGLVGARLIAVACTTIAGVATASATKNLFGQTASFFAAVAFALSGPVIHLAHLAVYDQIALTGVALSFWAITRASITHQRVWLVVAAVALGIGAISKYPMIACLIPLAGVTMALRGKRMFTDLFILVFVIAGLLLSYAMPVRGQLVAFLIWRTHNNPSFGVTSNMVRYDLVYYGVIIWALAIVGWLTVKGQRRLATVLIGGMLLWPAYHLLIDNSISAEKHLVFGFVFGLPLVGALFATIWRQGGPFRWLGRSAITLSVLALAVMGVAQAQTLDAGWADTRPATAYLMAHVKPGETLLISDAAPYQMELYIHGKITSPWDVYDTSRVQQNQLTTSVCEVDWFVDEEGGDAWPSSIRQSVLDCGIFKEVYASVSNVTQLGSNLNFVTYPVKTTVWINIAKH